MNAQVPATREQRPQITAGAQVAALVPQTLDEAFRVAQAIAGSGLAPRGLEKPEQIIVAIMAGAELGFAPFQSLQSFAVVNGRPCLWGDGLVALVRRNGCMIREWHDGDTAFCEVTRPDTGEKITRSFSQADAIKAALAGKTGPWQQYPQRMRAMRARAWALRDGCADMLRGFPVAEEVADYTETVRDVTPAKPAGLTARLAAAAPTTEGFNAAQAEAHDTETGEVVDAEVEEITEAFPGDAPAPQEAATTVESVAPASQVLGTLKARVSLFRANVEKASSSAEMTRIRQRAAQLFRDVDGGDPEEVGTSHELAEWFDGQLEAMEAAEREAEGK